MDGAAGLAEKRTERLVKCVAGCDSMGFQCARRRCSEWVEEAL